MLSQKQQDVADAFAGQDDPARRFDNGRWTAWPSRHPRLGDAVVAMDCDLIGTMETETHMLFAGGIAGLEVNPETPPLIGHQRQYKSLDEPSGASAASPPATHVKKREKT